MADVCVHLQMKSIILEGMSRIFRVILEGF